MNFRNVTTAFLVFLLVLTQLSEAAPPRRQSLEQLLEASGLSDDLKSLEQTIVSESVNAAKQNPNPELSRADSDKLMDLLMLANLRDSFQYELLLDEVTYFLKKKLSQEDVEAALAWYESELGQRFVAAEAHANTPEGIAAVQKNASHLLGQKSLAAMAAEIDQAVGFSDALVDMQLSTQKAFVVAGLALTAPVEDISQIEHYDWTKIETADRQALRAPISQYVHASFVYTVQNFSEAERQQYKSFLTQPASIKVLNAAMTGIGKAMEIGMHNFLNELVNDLKNPSPELELLVAKIQKNNPVVTNSAPAAGNATADTVGAISPDW